MWRDCSTIERNGYEPEGAEFRQTVRRPLLDPLHFERARHDASLGIPPKDSKGFAAQRPSFARAIAPLTPTVGTPGVDVQLAGADTPNHQPRNWRGTAASEFAIRPLRRVEYGTFDSVAELTYQGKPFNPSLTVDEYTPGVWISWPDGASRAIAIGRDPDGQNPAYLLDTGVRRATRIKLDFYPVQIYWRPDLGAALLTGPTGEGFRIGAVKS